MKKLILGLLAGLVMLSACSKDEDYTAVPEGRYVANTGDLSITVLLSSARCASITVNVCEDRAGTWSDFRTEGSYPKYVYAREGFDMQVRFRDPGTFTATLFGVLSEKTEGPNLDGQQSVALDCTTEFNRVK